MVEEWDAVDGIDENDWLVAEIIDDDIDFWIQDNTNKWHYAPVQA